ncbi:MAG: carbonic anhydrase, partial [Clostridia bacterium]|nr:carbonic anhydrase [Clostridia bacterium]
GSILYGLLHLHTPFMLIVGHSDCGALKAAMSDYSGEPGAIARELDNVKKSLHEIQSSAYTLREEPSVKYTQLAELNVDMQVNYMLANTAVARLVEEGSLSIIGIILDLHNVYGQGYGKSYLINHNGVRNLQQLQQIKELKGLAARMQRLTAV